MISIYENSEFILRTTVRSEICPFGWNKNKPPHMASAVRGFSGQDQCVCLAEPKEQL